MIGMFEWIILLALAVVGLLYVVSKVYEAYEKAQIPATERAIRKATGDANIARLVMFLREDLYSSSRSQEKLRKIAANPKLAMIAFRTALQSRDVKAQKAGIMGLAHLNRAEAVVPLLEVHQRSAQARSEASEALVELAKTIPIRGQGGFLEVVRQFGQTRASSSYTLHAQVMHLERLLKIAAQRRTAFSDEEYSSLFNWAIQYARRLSVSEDTSIRHIGEDFEEAVRHI